jgi:arylsulfatase A-like enzyme
MMRSLDDSVARVLGALHDAGRDRDTLVVFTSDNGGERWSYNWPMSEGKGTLREGGLRVPAAVRWPGVTAAGRVSDVPVITMDWTATLVAAAGARPDAAYPLDGADLRPVLGGGALAERTLFWRTRAQDAARQGRWKLWRAAGGTASLYDVMEDPGEKFDRRAFQPDVARELEAEFERWNATVLPRPTTPRPAGPGGR